MRIADESLLCPIILLLWHDIQLNDMISQYIFVINPFSAGTIFRRQIPSQNLTSENGLRTERIKIFLMAIDPYHMFSN